MLYSIFKDNKPLNTINEIKNIIENLNIQLKEDVFVDNNSSAPVSVRLCFKNNENIGTNGKGTCIENAMASAYAEFMERLQNLVLLPNNLKYLNIIPDKIVSDGNIVFNDIKLQKYFHKKLLIYKKINESKPDKNLLYCPFYSVKKQSLCNLPIQVIGKIVGTNGMAAGNTLEEAIVQGLSEICERYALKEIYKKKLALPNIPKEIYLKYENIKNMIDYFESNGFKIYIKDASLNGKLPVICTIFEDTINNIFIPSVGSHPSIPIAIERTLTEFTQGMVLSELRKTNFIPYPYFSQERLKYTSIEEQYNSLFLCKNSYERTNELSKIFFNNNSSYNFSSETWVAENKIFTNKELLKFLTDKLINISDDIYIRYISFLGFPTVYIFIPELSDVVDYTEENLSKERLDTFWSSYNITSDKQAYNIESLLKLAEIYSFTECSESRKIFCVPFEYIALLCSIVLNDVDRVLKFYRIVVEQNKIYKFYTDNQLEILNIINDYYTLISQKVDISDCIKNLRKKYKKANVSCMLDIVNELTFEMILDIIIKKKKTKVFRNKKLIKQLENKYKQNLPNQLCLKDIFNRISTGC